MKPKAFWCRILLSVLIDTKPIGVRNAACPTSLSCKLKEEPIIFRIKCRIGRILQNAKIEKYEGKKDFLRGGLRYCR